MERNATVKLFDFTNVYGDEGTVFVPELQKAKLGTTTIAKWAVKSS